MFKSIFQGADIFLIFFSVVSPETYKSALEKVTNLQCSGMFKSTMPIQRL